MDPFERAVLREEHDVRADSLVRGRGALLIHAVVYVAVNLMLVVIWATTSRDQPWFLYVLFGWGIGLAAHAAAYRARLGRQRELERQFGSA